MTQPPTDELLIRMYIEMRDWVAKEKARHKETVLKPVKKKMVTIENEMLRRLNERGANNSKTDAGLAYKKRAPLQPKVIDRDQFLNYVQDHSAWSLLTNHVSKEEVEAILELTGSPPPGVEISAPIIKVYFNR